MAPAGDSSGPIFPSAGIFRRIVATGIDLLIWFTIAWFTWMAGIPILFGATSKWRALAELSGINLLVPACLSLEMFTGATIGKWAVGLTMRHGNAGRTAWLFRLLRWLLKSSPWLLMTVDVALVIVFEREVTPPMLQSMTEQLGRAGDWCLGLLDHLQISDWWGQWLMIPLAAFSQLGIGVLLLVPLVSGELLVLLPSRRTLIDRLSWTRVTRRHSGITGHGFEVLGGNDRHAT
jgi:hypothetical protein